MLVGNIIHYKIIYRRLLSARKKFHYMEFPRKWRIREETKRMGVTENFARIKIFHIFLKSIFQPLRFIQFNSNKESLCLQNCLKIKQDE